MASFACLPCRTERLMQSSHVRHKLSCHSINSYHHLQHQLFNMSCQDLHVSNISVLSNVAPCCKHRHRRLGGPDLATLCMCEPPFQPSPFPPPSLPERPNPACQPPLPPVMTASRWTGCTHPCVPLPMLQNRLIIDVINEPDCYGASWTDSGQLADNVAAYYLEAMDAMYAVCPSCLFQIQGSGIHCYREYMLYFHLNLNLISCF